MSLFAVFLLVAPLLMLSTAVVALCSYGPLGWAAAALLILAVVLVTGLTGRLVLRWWRGTNVGPRPQYRPADARRVPPA